MKKVHLYKVVITGLILVVIVGSVLVFSLMGKGLHTEDIMEENYDINLNDTNISRNIKFKENLKKDVQLIYGDEVFNLKNNVNENIEKISKQLYKPAQNAKVTFAPQNDEIFVFENEVYGQQIDLDSLALYINKNLKNKQNTQIAIPTSQIEPKIKRADLENVIKLRSQYTTSIVNSQENRKHNVGYALKAFNGLIVMPDEEISFNKVTGQRTIANNYKDANIILDGKYVLGIGGGVCQASTTLYNALIRSDIEILKVNNHTLPVGYVPKAFDAMVNDSGSDLVFKNTTGYPLYFMTSVDDENVTVKIFGAPLEDGLTIDTESVFVKEIPHKGDKIIPDTAGEYSNKITFKGEYLRIKQPKNGSEYLGYLVYSKNGQVINKKQVRHVYYSSQEGIIMEGTENLYEGMKLPENNVVINTPRV